MNKIKIYFIVVIMNKNVSSVYWYENGPNKKYKGWTSKEENKTLYKKEDVEIMYELIMSKKGLQPHLEHVKEIVIQNI